MSTYFVLARSYGLGVRKERDMVPTLRTHTSSFLKNSNNNKNQSSNFEKATVRGRRKAVGTDED